MLGPNGAGKTTMLRMLATLLPIDGGEASIFGVDVRRAAAHGPPARRRHRAVRLGRREPHRPPRTSGSSPACTASRRSRRKATAATCSSEFGLTDAADRQIKTFSGGMRRRLDLAASLISAAAADLPRRADHRSRPAHPRPDVGHHPRPGRATAAPCCSPRSTSTRPTSSPTGSRSSTAAVKVAEGTADELKTSVGSSTLQLRLADPATPQAACRHRPPGARRGAGADARGRRHERRADRRQPGRRRADRAAPVRALDRRARPSRSPPSTRCSWPSPATAPRTRTRPTSSPWR